MHKVNFAKSKPKIQDLWPKTIVRLDNVTLDIGPWTLDFEVYYDMD